MESSVDREGAKMFLSLSLLFRAAAMVPSPSSLLGLILFPNGYRMVCVLGSCPFCPPLIVCDLHISWYQ